MQSLSHLKHSPLKWGSSLYFAMGFAVCRSAHGLGSSVQGAGDLGCSDSVLDLSDHVALDDQVPVEPCSWSLYRTKKFWGVGSQMLSGVLFGVSGPFASASAVLRGQCCCLCRCCLQRCYARHHGRRGLNVGAIRRRPRLNTSAGRVRSTILRNWSPRAVWCGLRGGSATASRHVGDRLRYDASVRSWTVVLLLLCAALVALGLYHLRALPSGGSASEGRSLRDGLIGPA